MSGTLNFTVDVRLREDLPPAVADWLRDCSQGSVGAPGFVVPSPALAMIEEAAWLLALPEISVEVSGLERGVVGHVRLRHDGAESAAIYGTCFLLAPYVMDTLIGVEWSDLHPWPTLFLTQGGLPFVCPWNEQPIPVEHEVPWRVD